MAKKVQAMVKLQINAGKATPAPPVGTALGPHGVNIMDFCKNFNAKTAKDEGLVIPVVVIVTSIFFCIYLFAVDYSAGNLVQWVLRRFGAGA